MHKSLVWFVVGVVATLGVVGVVWASSSGEAEVRINARRLDDGRVEVAMQQRGAGEWAAPQTPDARFLAPDAATGRWFSSSPLSVAVADADARDAAGQLDRIGFFCLVTHQHPGDEAFWNIVGLGAGRMEEIAGVRVVIKAGPKVGQQAERIRECVAEGASGIATTLPDPAGLADAIAEARSAGIAVVTFNSGLNGFVSVGSSRHHSVDEVAAGHEAGVRLNQHGTTGVVLCVVHETANVGLEERCDGLGQGYAGAVERLSVADTGVSDLAGSGAAITARLRASGGSPQVAGIVALNTQIGLAALEAIAAAGSAAVVATFDQNSDVLRAINRGEILFAIDTLPANQSWYALSSLLVLVFSEERARSAFGLDDPNLIVGQVALAMTPRVFTKDNADAWLAVNRRAAEESE